MKFDIVDALQSLTPGAAWRMYGKDYDKLEWFDENVEKPTSIEIEDEIKRLQDDYDAKEYQRNRVSEYPSIGDQLDALFHAGVFPPEMAVKIQAVKDKYPKGS